MIGIEEEWGGQEGGRWGWGVDMGKEELGGDGKMQDWRNENIFAQARKEGMIK